MNEPSTQERIAIVDLADDLQVRKQRIFKVLPFLGIRPTQRREQSPGNQNVATVSATEAAAIRAEIVKSSDAPTTGNSPQSGSVAVFYSDDVGFFYIIQLEPEHGPGRFKVGFTMDLDGRLQKHRCAAPFAQYLNTRPCKRIWDRAAIDCVLEGCSRPAAKSSGGRLSLESLVRTCRAMRATGKNAIIWMSRSKPTGEAS